VAVDDKGEPFAPGDVGAQTARALEIITAALKEAGAEIEHVVRTRVFTTDMHPDTQAAVGAAHLRCSRTILPASTMLAVSALAHPAFLVEIEADAVIP
jgi:enamine deaminase RidA (YjgF/YER057c/UK114 family)